MYYLLYGLLYIISLLPLKVLYIFSDFLFLLIYNVVGYRRKVVINNLFIAFPEKTERERRQIEKRFYRNFIDTFIETIKLLSISKKNLQKRYTVNIDVINSLYASGQNVIIISAHYFNWEIANMGTSFEINYPLVTAYFPVQNKAFDMLIYNLRTRFKSTFLIDATRFRHQFHSYARGRFALGLVADQNPVNPASGYWISFFGKPASFVKGPEKMSKANNAAVVYLHFYPVKRGYYKLEYQLITVAPKEFADGMLTKRIITVTEECIRNEPAAYLWSHKRWKNEFKQEVYGDVLIN